MAKYRIKLSAAAVEAGMAVRGSRNPFAEARLVYARPTFMSSSSTFQ
jgi:hypothetical protein